MDNSTFFRYNSIVDIGVLKTGETVSVKKISDERFIMLVGNLKKLFFLEESVYLKGLFPAIHFEDTMFGLDIKALSINEMPRKLVIEDFDKLFVTDTLVKKLIEGFDKIPTKGEHAFRFLCEVYRQMMNERPSLVDYIKREATV